MLSSVAMLVIVLVGRLVRGTWRLIRCWCHCVLWILLYFGFVCSVLLLRMVSSGFVAGVLRLLVRVNSVGLLLLLSRYRLLGEIFGLRLRRLVAICCLRRACLVVGGLG